MTPDWWWSWLLATVGVFGLWLAGRKDWRGWAVGLGAQVLWIAYAVVSQQWGFLASVAAYGSVYGLNWWRWTRQRSPGGGAGEHQQIRDDHHPVGPASYPKE